MMHRLKQSTNTARRVGAVKENLISNKLYSEKAQMQRHMKILDLLNRDTHELKIRRDKLSAKLENLELPRNHVPITKDIEKTPTKYVQSYQELMSELNGGEQLSYFDDIRHSINLLVHALTNSLVIELCLRKDMVSGDPVQEFPSSVLFRENLICKIKNREIQQEILQILKSIIDEGLIKESLNLDNRLDFKNILDQQETRQFFNHELMKNSNFNDIEFWRLAFTFYKSGQYLNYEHSDTFSQISNINLVDFNSPAKNNSEIIERFEKLFGEYNENQALAHINLIGGVINILTTSRSATPTSKIFQYLFEKFGDLQLFAYQSIVYNVLPNYLHIQTILATQEGRKPEKFKTKFLKTHFLPIIQENPDMLKSLIKYQIYHKDTETFLELLKFFRLSETSHHEKALKRTTLSAFVSKSRFSAYRKPFAETDDVIYTSESSLIVPVEVIYVAIQGCIELGLFEYIDLLFTKLFLFNVKKKHDLDSNRFLALSVGLQENLDKEELLFLISENLTPTQVSNILMTKDLLILLLRACREGKDMGRLLWLMPYIDQYIDDNYEKGKLHLETIKNFYNQSILDENYQSIAQFEREEKIAPFTSEFIESIYYTLKEFRIDGKINKYDSIFDFENTIEAKVYQKKR